MSDEDRYQEGYDEGYSDAESEGEYRAEEEFENGVRDGKSQEREDNKLSLEFLGLLFAGDLIDYNYRGDGVYFIRTSAKDYEVKATEL